MRNPPRQEPYGFGPCISSKGHLEELVAEHAACSIPRKSARNVWRWLNAALFRVANQSARPEVPDLPNARKGRANGSGNALRRQEKQAGDEERRILSLIQLRCMPAFIERGREDLGALSVGSAVALSVSLARKSIVIDILATSVWARRIGGASVELIMNTIAVRRAGAPYWRHAD